MHVCILIYTCIHTCMHTYTYISICPFDIPNGFRPQAAFFCHPAFSCLGPLLPSACPAFCFICLLCNLFLRSSVPHIPFTSCLFWFSLIHIRLPALSFCHVLRFLCLLLASCLRNVCFMLSSRRSPLLVFHFIRS